MRRIFRILFAVACVVFVCSGVLLFQFYRSYQKSDEEYTELAAKVLTVRNPAEKAEPQAEQADVPPLLYVDFEELKKINEEITAWIEFPGQEVSYPVTQGEDNDYYLTHTSQGTYNAGGGIFADSRNNGILNDENTVIYGHNMRNGSMFGFLKNYQEEEYYKQYPTFDLYVPEGGYRCRILACCRVEADWENFPTAFETGGDRTEFVKKMQSMCTYETVDVNWNVTRPLVMLSTCTGRGHRYRLIILAEAYDMAEAEQE